MPDAQTATENPVTVPNPSDTTPPNTDTSTAAEQPKWDVERQKKDQETAQRRKEVEAAEAEVKRKEEELARREAELAAKATGNDEDALITQATALKKEAAALAEESEKDPYSPESMVKAAESRRKRDAAFDLLAQNAQQNSQRIRTAEAAAVEARQVARQTGESQQFWRDFEVKPDLNKGVSVQEAQQLARDLYADADRAKLTGKAREEFVTATFHRVLPTLKKSQVQSTQGQARTASAVSASPPAGAPNTESGGRPNAAADAERMRELKTRFSTTRL